MVSCVLLACSVFTCSIYASATFPMEAEEIDSIVEFTDNDMTQINESISVSSIDLSGLNLDALSIDQLIVLRELIDAEFIIRGYTYYQTLKLGSTGNAVTNLQNKLSSLGYFDDKSSGTFSSKTEKALKQFEATNDLEIDGIASNEDQQLLFSSDAKAFSGETVLGEEKKVIVVTKASDEDEPDAEHPEYGKYDYTEFFRYADDHIGDKVKITGKVVQALGDKESGYNLRVSLNSNSSNIVFVYVFFNPGYNILENDKLIIYGTALSPVTYESTTGREVTIPGIIADEIVLQ